MKIEEWLVEHISKHPNITFGSLYRDICLTSEFDADSLRPSIEKCKSEGLIVETKIKYDCFFNLSKELDREKKINSLFN
jgi:hypothetical protein